MVSVCQSQSLKMRSREPPLDVCVKNLAETTDIQGWGQDKVKIIATREESEVGSITIEINAKEESYARQDVGIGAFCARRFLSISLHNGFFPVGFDRGTAALPTDTV